MKQMDYDYHLNGLKLQEMFGDIYEKGDLVWNAFNKHTREYGFEKSIEFLNASPSYFGKIKGSIVFGLFQNKQYKISLQSLSELKHVLEKWQRSVLQREAFKMGQSKIEKVSA